MTTRSHVLHAMCYCNEYCETEDVPLEDTNEDNGLHQRTRNTGRRLNPMPNTLYCGDNLDILRQHIPDESVDSANLPPLTTTILEMLGGQGSTCHLGPKLSACPAGPARTGPAGWSYPDSGPGMNEAV